MKFSIVIPAFNESACVPRAIIACLAQSVPRTEFEIIVVDNGSTDGTLDAAILAGADRVITEPVKGTNIARNRGYRESTGTIVAFLDADSAPPPDWLRTIEQELSRPWVVAVSGPYDYGFTGIRRVADILYTHLIFPRAASFLRFVFRRKAGVLIAGNFAVWRSALDVIGGIPPVVFWGDDSAIAMLLARKVGRVIFTPRLTVRSSPRRFKEAGTVRTTLRYIRYFLNAYFSDEYR